MSFITNEIRKNTPLIKATEHVADPIVQFKLFTPWSSWTWFIIELDEAEDIAFGYAFNANDPDSAELGSISLKELEGLRGPGPSGIFKVERDRYWHAKPLSRCKLECLPNLYAKPE